MAPQPVARVHVETRKHGLMAKKQTPGNPSQVLPAGVFKLYYDIKVHHRLEDGPKHILMQLRVMRSQPKKVQTAVTFYVRTGAWFAHSECVLLSLMANQSLGRPPATSLQTLGQLAAGQVHEPEFTCSLSGDQIQEILVKPYEVSEFSIHTRARKSVGSSKPPNTWTLVLSQETSSPRGFASACSAQDHHQDLQRLSKDYYIIGKNKIP
ncbi:hypothetical protein GWK47_034527 [Chionoecetes opilio]|uniref:Uncharacterized protein n=1 Tax=Chionoecetes opilio TaxID=41210 RepID=A0A8J4YNX2_CHIOP|nr:hypothetical protein GWK47_034527 [Chionoecetes opilio]